MNLKEKNKQRWDDMSIPVSMGPTFKAVADRLMFHKPRYEAVSKALKEKGYDIPWEFIAVAHNRESNGDFTTYLGNGQKLTKKTTIVPKGRGPFSTWEEGAIDALLYAPPYAAKNKDWSIGGTLTKLEEYNGLGYARMDKPSPYLWAGTNQYVKGKYVADGKYDPDHVDKQLGVAGLLKFMGYGATSKVSTPVAATTAAVGAVGAATAIAVTNDSWYQHIADHAWMYGIGAGVVLFVIAFALSQIKKDDPVA